MKHLRKSLLLVVIALSASVMLAGSAMSDHFIKQASHTDAIEIMGQKQPAVDDTMTVWLKDGKSCMQSADGKTYIFEMESAELYTVDHAARTYSVMPMDISAIFDEATKGLDEEDQAEADMARSMMQQMAANIQISVTPTEETKTIKDWKATKYVMDMTMPMGTTTTEMWVTQDINIDLDMYKTIANSKMAMMPGYQKILAETQKIKGIPVYSTTATKVMGTTVKSTSEILEVAEKDAPAGIFDIPEDYKEVDMMDMTGAGQ